MQSMFDKNLDLSAKVLDFQMQRQNLVMSNLANIKVPQYKPRRLEFEGELQAALGRDVKGKMTRTQEGHLPHVFDAKKVNGEVERKYVPRVVYGMDSVNMDEEMSIMAKNSLHYNAVTTIVRRTFEGMQKIIQDGSK